MGLLKFTITIESDSPPQLTLGQYVFGGQIVALNLQEPPILVSATWLAEKSGLTKATVLKKLEGFNQGTSGKHMFDSKIALRILSSPQNHKRGAKRIN